MKAQETRLGLACLCVLFLLALPGISNLAAQRTSKVPIYRSSTPGASLSTYYAEGDMVARLFEHLAGVHEQTDLPEHFRSELFDPARWGPCQSYTVEGFVGLYWPEPQGAFADAVEQALETSGWQRVGFSEESSSFIKEGGMYSWVNLRVFYSSDYMSVVLNYRKED